MEEKNEKDFFISILIALTIIIIPVAGFTMSCADKVVCYYVTANVDSGDYHRVGEISTPTCWKIFHQCRPWHCEGYKDTN